MHVVHLGQVLHARGDAPQHAQELQDGELAVVLLEREPPPDKGKVRSTLQ